MSGPVRRYVERQNAFQAWGQYATAKGSRQTRIEIWLEELAPTFSNGSVRVLDLGCGDGRSIDVFSSAMPAAKWHGVDIEGSPEVATRIRTDRQFDTFNGTELPYPDAHFDLIYSRQVFEHVRHPDALAKEVARVLRRGGAFLGEVSYLEPYHSLSIFNFTPFGMISVLRDAGLDPTELRPGIDGLSLIARQMLGGAKWLDFLFKASPLNGLISLFGTAAMLTSEHKAFLKLQYCGQFSFLAVRHDDSSIFE